jgi:hypothetical protein
LPDVSGRSAPDRLGYELLKPGVGSDGGGNGDGQVRRLRLIDTRIWVRLNKKNWC